MSSSEYTDESDDDYAPIQIQGWGNQTVNNGRTTEITVSKEGWASLIDPSIQLKAGGIGSGQLHRKGGNFKPVDEQYIVNQRLGKPIPKSIGGGSKKKKGKKKKSGGSAPSKAPSRAPSKPRPFLPPAPVRSSRPPLPPSKSAWGQQSLADTPFWESANGSMASKYATPPQPQRSMAREPPRQEPVRPQPIRQEPMQPEPPRQASVWQEPPRHEQPRQEALKPEPVWQEPVRPRQPLLGSSASKYAPASAVPAVPPPAPSTPTPINTTIRLDTPPPRVPCLNFTIELTVGISAHLSVYEDDDPKDVVDAFETKHHLNMSDDAKSCFASKIAELLRRFKSQ